MLMLMRWKDITNEINNSDEEFESCDYKWSKNSWFINCVDIEMSSSY